MLFFFAFLVGFIYLLFDVKTLSGGVRWHHQYALKCHNLNNSISLHRHHEGHLPAFHKASVLHFESKIKPRYNLENLEILARQNSLINHLIPDNTPLQEWSVLIHAVNNRTINNCGMHDRNQQQSTRLGMLSQVEGATTKRDSAQQPPGSGSDVLLSDADV